MGAEWFGQRLKELREQAGLSQKELADKVGLSQRAVSHWEQGLREPGWSNVVALAEALGVNCLAFLEEAAERPKSHRGRPPKAQQEQEPQPKRPRRRPRENPDASDR
jgi:transcriptional regulator with XRE-family HTH domain